MHSIFKGFIPSNYLIFYGYCIFNSERHVSFSYQFTAIHDSHIPSHTQYPTKIS